MKRALLFTLGCLLLPGFAFPTSAVRMTLERAAELSGEWQGIPAETLPVVEGGFVDSFDSQSAFYRMKVESLDDPGPPTTMSLDKVPVIARALAEECLNDNRDMDGDNSWEDAVLASIAYLVYNPAIEGIAYIEFKVIEGPPPPPENPLALPPPPPEDRGYILISVTRNDIPIVDFSTEGLTRTERLRARAGSVLVRIFRYDAFLWVAENAQGERVAQIGPNPVRWPDTILDHAGKSFHTHVDEQGEQLPTNVPALTPEPYESYQSFKQHYVQSEFIRMARQHRAEKARIQWGLHDGIDPDSIVVQLGVQTTVLQDKEAKTVIAGDPNLATIEILALGLSITGKKIGGTILHVVFADNSQQGYALIVNEGGILSSAPTSSGIVTTAWETFWAGSKSDQRYYEQFTHGDCAVGCGPCAWAMLYGWFDYKELADAIDGTAPSYNNQRVKSCMGAVNEYVETYCVGDDGATNPWDMYKGYKWAKEDRSLHYSIDYEWTVPPFTADRCYEIARDTIKNKGIPAIIGLNLTTWTWHYPLAYVYRYRYKKQDGVVIETERQFKCNMGWGTTHCEWHSAYDVWFGAEFECWD
ncbi:MAG: hypothetical protein Q8Q12_07350 [bacterium]|nr:hypothetical protein [bacterium]